MLPELTTAFGLTTLGVSSLLGLYYYTYSTFAIVAGASLDRWGAKYSIPIGVALLAVGIVMFGLGISWAATVGRLLQGQHAQVNLIPLNPTAGYGGVPTGQTAAYRFQEVLKEYGLPSTIRQRRGIDIAAGCGQLATARK